MGKATCRRKVWLGVHACNNEQPRQPHCFLLHGDMHFLLLTDFSAVNLKIVFSAYLLLNYCVFFFFNFSLLFSVVLEDSFHVSVCDDELWFLVLICLLLLKTVGLESEY
jgi:hypothetical protein